MNNQTTMNVNTIEALKACVAASKVQHAAKFPINNSQCELIVEYALSHRGQYHVQYGNRGTAFRMDNTHTADGVKVALGAADDYASIEIYITEDGEVTVKEMGSREVINKYIMAYVDYIVNMNAIADMYR